MNIKDFLIDNYIWILVIILITIITIIGFIADKKRGGKKEKNANPAPQNMNNQPMAQPQMNANPQPVQFQQSTQMQPNQMNNNMGLNFDSMNTTVRPLNQMENNQLNTPQPMTTEPTPIQSTTPNIGLVTNPQPIENIAPNVEQEPMYQPLSEQKPVIAPQPVPNLSAVQPPIGADLNSAGAATVNSMQPTNNTLNVIPSMNPGVPNQPAPMMNEQPTNAMPTYNSQPQAQPINNNTFAQTPNFIPNNTTVPQPASPIPEPQPVIPEPIMQGNYNQAPNMGMGQNMAPTQPVGQTIPNPNENQAIPNANPQPISFVYGPQNNNPNM